MNTEKNDGQAPLESIPPSRAYITMAVMGTGVIMVAVAALMPGSADPNRDSIAPLDGIGMIQQTLAMLGFLACGTAVLAGIQKKNARSFVALALRHPKFRIIFGAFCALGCFALSAFIFLMVGMAFVEKKTVNLFGILCLLVGAFFVLGLSWGWVLVALGSPKAIEKIKAMVGIAPALHSLKDPSLPPRIRP